MRAEPLEERRLLAVVSVNTLSDTVDLNDGVTSLREAVFATNLVSGADTINFAPSLTSGGPAKITLTQGELKITDDLTITGPGANLLTIDASGNDPTPDINNRDGTRVFTINDGTAAIKTVAISGLALTGGDVNGSGGAIAGFSENLAVSDCTISGNSALSGGGISGGGFIFSQQGGVNTITYSDLTLTNCNVTGNAAGNGGGISAGSVTIVGGEITGNSASRIVTPAGSTSGNGGGISATNMTVSDSTISGNSARGVGGGIYSIRKLNVSGSTISTNVSQIQGGGIFHQGRYPSNADYSVTIVDSRISDNSVTGGVISGNGGGIFDRMGDLTVIGSTISGNTTTFCGGGIAIGRLSVLYSTNVTIADSIISGNKATGGSGGGVYCATRGNLSITGSAFDQNFAGSKYGYTIFDAGGGGVFGRTNSATIASSSFTGNSTNGFGGGVVASQVFNGMSIVDCTATGNSALSGGGIASVGGKTFAVTGSTVSGNTARLGGGGIYADSQNMTTINNCTVASNTLAGLSGSAGGGGIRGPAIGGGGILSLGPATIFGSTITQNTTSLRGGGILAGTLTLTGSVVSSNYAAQYGGGLGVFGTVSVANTTISGNSTKGEGGGISVRGGTLSVSASTISDNTAAKTGGGISGLNVTVNSSTINGNSASGYGGGIFGSGTLTNSTISGNYAAGGGGIYCSGDFTIQGSTISNNWAGFVVGEAASARGSGGGIFANKGQLTITSSTISGNAALSSGGGLYSLTATPAIRHSTLAFNQADAFGGGVFFAGGMLTLDHTIVAKNTSNLGPDITGLFGGSIDAKYSLIGTNKNSSLAEAPVGAADANGNLVGGPVHGVIDPKLGQLGSNGGPTDTYILQPGSPAIDAGDPAAVAGVGGVPEFDQRGAPFARVLDGDGPNGARVDIGAVEVVSPTSIGSGDFNGDLTVDAADFNIYQDTYGSTSDLRADGNGNGIVDDADRLVWMSHFGQVLPLSLTGRIDGPFVPLGNPVETQLPESVTIWHAMTVSEPIQTGALAARATSFATLGNSNSSHDVSTKPPGSLKRCRFVESDSDELLLLAIDRVGRSARRDPSKTLDQAKSDRSTSGIDYNRVLEEPLTLSLVRWQ